MKFAYYPGCSLDGSGIEYGLSMKRTAAILGIELQELEDWNCCGATSGHNTDKLLSLALPARNIAIAEKTGLDMVAPCAACYSRHRNTEHVIHHDPEMKAKIEEVIETELTGSSQTLSILDVLANKLGIDQISGKVTRPLTGMKAASYYGCLLVRPVEHTGFDDAEDPQSMDQVMQALGAETVDWSFKTECCGAALVTSRPDVGNPMLAKVLQDAKENGAECIVTACPLCMMNLDMRQKSAEKAAGTSFNMPIYYVTELLAIAYGDAPRTVGVNKHFVEAEKYLETVKVRAEQARLEAEEAERQKAELARQKAEAAKQKAAAAANQEEGQANAASSNADQEAAQQKKIATYINGFKKNPAAMSGKLIADEARSCVLSDLVQADEKKAAKLAELMVTDMEKAQKAAEAFVTVEIKRLEKEKQ